MIIYRYELTVRVFIYTDNGKIFLAALVLLELVLKKGMLTLNRLVEILLSNDSSLLLSNLLGETTLMIEFGLIGVFNSFLNSFFESFFESFLISSSLRWPKIALIFSSDIISLTKRKFLPNTIFCSYEVVF